MQKKIIISFIAVNMFILVFALLRIDFGQTVTTSLSRLDDNQIRVYNKYGFTLEQMKQIEMMDGIDQVTFDNRNIFPRFEIELESILVNARGISIDEGNKTIRDLDYIAGTFPTEEYQVIVAQSLADVLVEGFELSNLDQLIGHEFVKGLTIVGVYEDTKDTTVEVVGEGYTPQDDGSFTKTRTYTFENSFMLFNRGREIDKDYIVQQINEDISNQYYFNGQTDIVVSNFDDSDSSNDDEEYFINYEESVANGAKGLIDPETKEYGDTINQYAFITVEDNRDQVVTELEEQYPDAGIVTSDSKYSDAVNSTQNWIKFIGAAVVLELLIFIPVIRNRR